MNYAQQIKHPNWQKKRLEVLTAHGFECENCGNSEEELHVHHSFYKRGAMIWQYETEELQCLCHKCHKNAHAKDEEIKILISDRNICKDHVIGVLKAMGDNPWTQLNSFEEVMGYLTYYGISGGILDIIANEIFDHNGKPHEVIEQSPFETSYYDIGIVCFKQPKDFISVLKAADKETKRRVASYKKVEV